MIDRNREYYISLTHQHIIEIQKMLDKLMDDARQLRDEYGIKMRDRYIERAQEHLVVVRDDFEQKVMKVKPTGSLDRQYEKDLS